MTSFAHETYIVLELPENIKDKIIQIREDNQDEFRASLPAEITVAGSSGVGVLVKGQDEEFVYNKIEEIAKTTSPFKLAFGEVERFAGSDIFAMKLKDETEIRKLHIRLKECGIEYENTKHEYNPHCTLRSRSPVSEEEAIKLHSLIIDDEFIVDTISVYMVDKIPLTKLYTVKLTGK